MVHHAEVGISGYNERHSNVFVLIGKSEILDLNGNKIGNIYMSCHSLPR